MTIYFNLGQGEERNVTVTINENGSGKDISGAALTATVFDLSDNSVLVTKKNLAAGGGTSQIDWVTDGTDGQFYIKFIESDTSSLDYKRYAIEVKMVIGDATTYPVKGEFNLTRTRHIG